MPENHQPPEVSLDYITNVARRQLAADDGASWLATVELEPQDANEWTLRMVEATLNQIETDAESADAALAQTLQQVALLGLLVGIALNKSDESEDEINVEIDAATIEQIGLSIIRTGSLAIRLTPADSDATPDE